jgi:hypothetical protein
VPSSPWEWFPLIFTGNESRDPHQLETTTFELCIQRNQSSLARGRLVASTYGSLHHPPDDVEQPTGRAKAASTMTHENGAGHGGAWPTFAQVETVFLGPRSCSESRMPLMI